MHRLVKKKRRKKDSYETAQDVQFDFDCVLFLLFFSSVKYEVKEATMNHWTSSDMWSYTDPGVADTGRSSGTKENIWHFLRT